MTKTKTKTTETLIKTKAEKALACEIGFNGKYRVTLFLRAAEFLGLPTEPDGTLKDQSIPMDLWVGSITDRIGWNVVAIDDFDGIRKTGDYHLRVAYVDGDKKIRFGRVKVVVVNF